MENNYDKTELPGITVIIPAFNAEGNITQLIQSLLNQDYPRELFEIIIVDNNSTDRTREIANKFPVKLLSETKQAGSYAARNKGLKNATGEYIAFIDADCIATIQWISEGIEALKTQSADIAAGAVEFISSGKKTAAQMYDSITHIQQKKTVNEQSAAQTANLLVKTSLFSEIGPFVAAVSGEDVRWTARASSKGFKLIYAPKAIVKHPARNLKELLKKRFRTGAGTVAYWRQINVPAWKILIRTLRFCLPRRPSMIRKAAEERGTPDMKDKMFSLFCVAYLCSLATFAGILSSVFHRAEKKTNP